MRFWTFYPNLLQLRCGWNQTIEDMDQDIDRGLRPGHVYLMPGDTNFPRPMQLTLHGQGLPLELVTLTVLSPKGLRILYYNLLPAVRRLQRRHKTGLSKSRREAGLHRRPLQGLGAEMEEFPENQRISRLRRLAARTLLP